MNRLLSSCLALAALSSLAAPALAQQKLDAARSEIVFVSKQMGVPVEGRFKKFDANVAFDPAKPQAAQIAFKIDTASASFGSPDTDAEVPKAAWFNAAKFPQATFQSSAVKALGGGKFEAAGKLTIKGATQDVTVPFTLAQTGALSTATGAFALKRLTFKIGEGEWADTSMVADEVQVRFKLVLTEAAAKR